MDRRLDSKQLKRALLEIGREYKCAECPVTDSYNGKPITLHIDHIDGNYQNNTSDNLRFLCPNCHSQTSNYGSKKLNINKEVKIKNIRVKKEKLKKDRPRKFEITKEELLKLIWEMPTTKVAELFNVSDKAIKQRCKLLGVEKPPRGYWTKLHSK